VPPEVVKRRPPSAKLKGGRKPRTLLHMKSNPAARDSAADSEQSEFDAALAPPPPSEFAVRMLRRRCDWTHRRAPSDAHKCSSKELRCSSNVYPVGLLTAQFRHALGRRSLTRADIGVFPILINSGHVVGMSTVDSLTHYARTSHQRVLYSLRSA